MKKHDFFRRTETISDASYRRRIVIAFAVFAVFAAGSVFAWNWLNSQPKEDDALKPLRATLETNEKIFKGALDSNAQVKSYPISAAVKNVKVNGLIGIQDTIDASKWRLQIIRGLGDTLKISLDELKQLPKKDVIFDFKCIEGWNQITHWAGVPLKDFMEHYHLQAFERMQYAGLQTPNKKYYVGIDMKSFLLPQTILCYEMNDKPLPMKQGYPLRLIIPVKYGIKHLKCIGTMFFSDQKPPDYWAQQGYDYYAGF
jgi:DMSO/TMAO reductase YedYZ molybdopterin-dependent catalytic subunit